MVEAVTFFVLIVLAVIVLDRLVTRQILDFFWLLTRNKRVAYATYAVLLLPGTLVHEFSHWLVARLLGVPASRPTIRPELEGDSIVLGYVRTAGTDPIRQSLIGAAPIFIGGALVAGIAATIFGFEGLEALLPGVQGVTPLTHRLRAALHVEDAWLWVYLIFSISNVMLPSESDRVAWSRVLVLLVVIGGLIYFLIGVPRVPALLVGLTISIMRALAFAFLLTIVIDLPVFIVFWMGTQVLAFVRG